LGRWRACPQRALQREGRLGRERLQQPSHGRLVEAIEIVRPQLEDSQSSMRADER
jgi:hypothetical protein